MRHCEVVLTPSYRGGGSGSEGLMASCMDSELINSWSQITNASLFVSLWEVQEPQGHWEEGVVGLQTRLGGSVCPETTGGKGITILAAERSTRQLVWSVAQPQRAELRENHSFMTCSRDTEVDKRGKGNL